MDQTIERPTPAPAPAQESAPAPALMLWQMGELITRAEMIELWQASRVALADQGESRYMRLCWAARELYKRHAAQGVTQTGAYKLLQLATLGS